MRVLCVTTNLSHPFTAGRVEMMISQGVEVETIGYERGDPSGRFPMGSCSVLGRIRSRAYLRRVPAMLRDVLKIRRAIRRSDLVWVNGADVALVVHVAGLLMRRPVVRDVPDIERILVVPGLRSRLLRRLDKVIEGHCALLVLTSPAAGTYYRDCLKINTPILVIENKVEPRVADAWQRLFNENPGLSCEKRAALSSDRPMRIGWFAQIRDRWSLELVERLASSFSEEFEIVIAGFAGPTVTGLEEIAERHPSIDYRGPFRHIEDLPRLHADVDLSLASVLPELPTSLAISNRFHDSCVLKTPLVVRAGTAVAERVAQHRIGVVLHEADPQAAAAELAAVTPADVASWLANLRALPQETSIHTDEAQTLAAALTGLLDDRASR